MFLQELNKKAILSLAIITIIAGTALAQKKIQDAPWFFIQLTDPQFGMFENNLGFEKETLLYEKVDEPTAYSNIDKVYREKYLKLFKDNKVGALFSGHLHNNRLLNDGQIELITTSALGKPLGNAPSGLRIVKIYSDRIEHAYFGLEELPDSVKFE